MRSLLVTAASMAIVLCSGCASIVSGTIQSISVDTPGCEAASCQLTNDKGTWYVKTPASVSVSRAYGNLTVVCSKEGFPSATTTVASSTKGMAFGNILFGGVIGAGVDIGTGAAYDYPVVISVPLACNLTNKLVVTDATPPISALKSKSRLGVRVENVSQALATSLGLSDSSGAYVTSVQLGSPAEVAGIKVGDIIREFGEVKLTDSNDLAARLNATKDGSVVVAKILSDGRAATIQIKIGPATEL